MVWAFFFQVLFSVLFVSIAGRWMVVCYLHYQIPTCLAWKDHSRHLTLYLYFFFLYGFEVTLRVYSCSPQGSSPGSV